jgi:hypothetical protein
MTVFKTDYFFKKNSTKIKRIGRICTDLNVIQKFWFLGLFIGKSDLTTFKKLSNLSDQSRLVGAIFVLGYFAHSRDWFFFL